MRKKIKKFWRRLWCKHTQPWYFYPCDQGWCGQPIPGGGLKITVCWQCGRVLDVTNFRVKQHQGHS